MIIFCDGFYSNLSKSGGYTIYKDGGGITVNYLDRDTSIWECELLGILEACRIAKMGDIVVSDCKGLVERISENRRVGRNWWEIQDVRDLIHKKDIHLIWQPRKINLAGKENQRRFRRRRNTLKKLRSLKEV